MTVAMKQNQMAPPNSDPFWFLSPASAIKAFYYIIITMQSHTLYCIIECLNIAFSLKTV